jgi:hypothetical protein
MRTRASGRTTWPLSLGAAALLALSAGVPAASAANEEPSCPAGQTLVRIEEKECPAHPHRPAIIVRRACCMLTSGQVRCEHIPHCPRVSPS